jgi:organic hydroperoxide reductase OsmC/OhrA
VVVLDYRDDPTGEMEEQADGAGQFAWIELRPTVTIAVGSNGEAARDLHVAAHHKCFVARSIKPPVRCAPTILVR